MIKKLVYIGLAILAIVCAVISKKITDSTRIAIFYLLYEMIILFLVYLVLFIIN